jgi:uncharacterized protein (TIGR02118 family)
MAGAKIVVLYPRPTDVAEFERVYVDEHIPLAEAKIGGKSKFVFTTVVGAPGGDPAWHRITEIHYPSMAALQKSLGSAGTQEAAAHAVSISTGGAPVFLIAEETDA